jgi:methylated-DNA-[protein]-cysteine S-methyltransferase
MRYITFNTDMGWVGILGSERGLRRATLPQRSAQAVCQLLGSGINYATWAPHSFDDLVQRLNIYFRGDRTTFTDELDLSEATAFQREVWGITRLIPFGETRSYAWMAEQINKPMAAQAVGQALARNPLPIIIPCHRVLTNKGGPGGYNSGLEWKSYLLNMEAATMLDCHVLHPSPFL